MNALVLPQLGPRRHPLSEYAEIFIVLAVVTVGGWYLPLTYRALGQIYLLAVIALSLRVSRWPVLVAAVISGLAWNFVFIPPQMSFSVLHFDDGFLLGIYFIVALGGGHFAVLRAAAQREKLLAESERLHRVLFDSITHELKTPLSVLRSASEQILTEDAGQRERMARAIRVTVQRLENLVANLLNQTRLESGVVRPAIEDCDARDLIAAARRAVAERLEGRSVAIVLPPGLPLLRADAPMMEQVIGNLLINAAVHTPDGTGIQVDAGVAPHPDRVFIRVTDNGPGIPFPLRTIIFEKFQKGMRSNRRGLGLGLSIVDGFMRAQNGEVRAEAGPEGGARFVLLLPRAKAKEVPAE